MIRDRAGWEEERGSFAEIPEQLRLRLNFRDDGWPGGIGPLSSKLCVMDNRRRKGPDRVVRRKLIEFDADTWHALQLLGKDSMKSLQELADEAFADLLRKHGRPVTLSEALRASARRLPANDEPASRKSRRP